MNRELRRILSLFALSSFTALLPLSPARSRPLVEKAMRDARRIAENEQQLVLKVKNPDNQDVALVVFHNSLKPFGFCFTFMLKSDWEVNQTGDTVVFTSESGATWVSFSVMTRQELVAVKGADGYEKAATMLDNGYATGLEKRGLTSKIETAKVWLEATPRRVLIWRLLRQPASASDRFTPQIPSHYLMPAPNGQMLNVMVGASTRNREDEVARSFLDSFRTTEDPECFFPAVQAMFEGIEK